LANFEKIKQDIQEYFGGRGKIFEHNPGIVGDLSKPKSIGLFFCIKTKDELSEIRKLLRKIKDRRSNLVAYVFAHSRERVDVITDQAIVYFDLNDFTLLGKKKEQIHRIFEKDRPELFISFVPKPDPFCYKLASEIHADFKVGPNTDGMSEIFNLVLDVDENDFNYIQFYEQVRHYLSVLNIKTR
jgi:hypothetical protein